MFYPELLICFETIQNACKNLSYLILFLILISTMQLFYVIFKQDKIISNNMKNIDQRNYSLFQLSLVIFSMVYIIGMLTDMMAHMFS